MPNLRAAVTQPPRRFSKQHPSGEVLEERRLLAFDIETTIVPDNVASQRVAEKLGMTCGERIEYAGLPHDVWVAERRLG